MKRLLHLSLLLILLGALISTFTRRETIQPLGTELFISPSGDLVHITPAWHSTVPPDAPAETLAKFTYDPIGQPIVFMGYLLFIIGFLYVVKRRIPENARLIVGGITMLLAIFFAWYFQRPGTSPLLHSPWMPIHVACCAMGYLLLTLSTLQHSNTQTLLHGLYFLSLGIITGSVWAAGAWGTYWSWDPKETCALVTWLLYAAALHIPPRHRQPLLDLSLLSILLTYLIPRIIPSLHSY